LCFHKFEDVRFGASQQKKKRICLEILSLAQEEEEEESEWRFGASHKKKNKKESEQRFGVSQKKNWRKN
jgi:hypothetical protein